MGKTRLVTELARRTPRAGARTLCGDCVELGEGELPYAPLVAALRPLVARPGPRARTSWPTRRARRAGDAAARARRRPRRPRPRARRRTPAPPSGACSRRCWRCSSASAARTPVLLLLEDIHWADRSTRAFLAFLARAMSTERVLAVCTYRSDELHRRHPLRPLLAELERDPRARRIELARLNRDELAGQLADILDDAARAELVERLYARSEGNPLFAEELLAAGGDGRGALPPTLRDALMVRTERLPERRPGGAARCSRSPSAPTTRCSPTPGALGRADLRDALREAADRPPDRRPSADGMYRFRHALLREVVARRPAAGRARRAAPRARPRARAPRRGGRRRRVDHGRRSPTTSARPGDQPAALRASVRAADRRLERPRPRRGRRAAGARAGAVGPRARRRGARRRRATPSC